MKEETKYLATCWVYWPSGPVACCDKHAQALIGLGKMVGSHIVATKIEQKIECGNCKNESNA